MKRHETPLARVNPSGKKVWVARWTDRTGKRRHGWPLEIPGTYALRRDAQAAIDACYEKDEAGPSRPGTVREYFEREWLTLHPRTMRTEKSYQGRVRSVLDTELDRVKFGAMPMRNVDRRHANLLVHSLLVDQGRAASGAQGVIRALSAMWQDAMDDLVAPGNPFTRVKVRKADPRVRKAPRKIRIWTWDEMHRFAAAAGEHEAMVRVLSDCGLRLGEMLALERRHFNGDTITVEQSAHESAIQQGTKTDHGEADAGRLAPVGPYLESVLRDLPRRIDTPLLFPTPAGAVWWEGNWRRDVWAPTVKATGMVCTPQEFRHSWVSEMRAAGIDVADAAAAAGHHIDTATRHYTHPLGKSFDTMRKATG